jgi:hypothetical protein
MSVSARTARPACVSQTVCSAKNLSFMARSYSPRASVRPKRSRFDYFLMHTA